jgi:hypothetical protein
VAKATGEAEIAATKIFRTGYRGVAPTKLVANAKLGIQIATRAVTRAMDKGYTGVLYAQCDAKLNKAFARHQDLMTPICLNKMVPRHTTSEEYVLGQVAEATKQAEKRAKWFYQHGIIKDPDSASGPPKEQNAL